MKKTKLYAVILIVIFIIGISSKVNAESVTFTATTDNQSLNEGEEVVITLNLSDIDAGENGIYTFGGTLVYDKEVFEELKDTNFEGKNNWSIAYNNEETEKNGTFLATRMTGLKTNQAIATLKLKTKTNIKSTRTQIKFTQVSSVGEDTIKIADEVITLNVVGTKKDDPISNTTNNTTNSDNTVDDNNGNTDNDNNNGNNNNNGNSNNGANGNGSSNNGNSNNGNGSNSNNGQTTITIKNTVNLNSNNKDTTASGNKIPKTGVENMPLVLVGISILVIMSIAYIKYKKNQDIK